MCGQVRFCVGSDFLSRVWRDYAPVKCPGADVRSPALTYSDLDPDAYVPAPIGPTEPLPTTWTGRTEIYSIGDVILESILGEADPNNSRPLSFSTLFSEGWREAWVPSPNGSGGAPRQGWINAADGNFYRLGFFTFGYGDNRPPRGDAYLGAYTLYTPLSRRLLLITNIPFYIRNGGAGGLPIVGPGGQTLVGPQSASGFGDIAITPRIMLHETQDFSLTTELAVLTPTGDDPVAGKAAVTPGMHFWKNIAGRWVVRGGVGVFVPTQGGGDEELISQLAIGQTLTDHDVPLFGDFTYYLSTVVNTPLSDGDLTRVTLTPGMRTHLGDDWYFLAGLQTPVTQQRGVDLGYIFWFMKAW